MVHPIFHLTSADAFLGGVSGGLSNFGRPSETTTSTVLREPPRRRQRHGCGRGGRRPSPVTNFQQPRLSPSAIAELDCGCRGRRFRWSGRPTDSRKPRIESWKREREIIRGFLESEGKQSLFLHPAVAELDDAIASCGVFLGVGDLDDGGAFVVEFGEEVHDFPALVGVEIAGGFVGEDQARAGDDGAGDGDELLLSAAELARIEVLLRDDVETVEGIRDERFAFSLFDVPIRKWDVEVFADGEVVEEVELLEDEADVFLVEFGAGALVELVDGVAVQMIFTGPVAVVHAENGKERRFAGAARSHEGHEVAFVYLEADLTEDEEFTGLGFDGFFDVLEFDHDSYVWSGGVREYWSDGKCSSLDLLIQDFNTPLLQFIGFIRSVGLPSGEHGWLFERAGYRRGRRRLPIQGR